MSSNLSSIAHTKPKDTIGIIALILSAAAMAASVLFVRWTDVGTFASAFYRVGLALPFLALFCILKSEPLWPKAGSINKTSKKALIWSGIFFAGDLFFWHLAIYGTTVANATFFATMAPIIVLLLSSTILAEKVEQYAWLGLVCCLFGGFFLAGSSYQFAPENLKGDAFGLITAFFFGSYTLAIRKARREVSAYTLSFSSAAISTAILFVIAIGVGDSFTPGTWMSLVALIALALVSQIGGQGLFAFALGRLPAAFSSLVIFLEGVFAAFMGWLFLNESLTLLQFIGGIIIMLGIAIAQRQKKNVKNWP